MPQAKWLKLGTAAFLSIGLLAPCGEPEAPDGEDEKNTEEQEEEEED